MKKNFKKSKFVILPALATLVLTGVASVTGTVAWFTANRAVTTTIESFNTAVLTSDLKLTYEADANSGTKAGTTANTIAIDGDLTHGSYDAKVKPLTADGGHLYVANLNDANTVTSYDDLGTAATDTTSGAHFVNNQTSTTNKWLAKAAVTSGETTTSNAVWYGVSWKMKFEGASKVDGKKNYLLLDPSSNATMFEDKVKDGTTLAGLRIALMTDNKVLVLSGDNVKTHIKAGATAAELDQTGFDEANFFQVGSLENYTKLNDNDNQLGGSYKYDFGEIGTDGLTLTCVAWYEGTDSAIQTSDSLKLSNVKTTFSFYSRTK